MAETQIVGDLGEVRAIVVGYQGLARYLQEECVGAMENLNSTEVLAWGAALKLGR